MTDWTSYYAVSATASLRGRNPRPLPAIRTPDLFLPRGRPRPDLLLHIERSFAAFSGVSVVRGVVSAGQIPLLFQGMDRGCASGASVIKGLLIDLPYQ